MNTNDEKSLTLNQYNIAGERVNANFNELKNYEDLEEIIVKNFEIDDEKILIINGIEKLKKVVLINCKISTNTSLKYIKTLKLDNCVLNKTSLLENIENLYIENCSAINLADFEKLNLKSLRIENTKTSNLSKIEQFVNLENLYLNEIDLNEYINYDKLIKLKRINFDGSNVKNKEEYLKQFENRDVEVSFTNDNKMIG